MPFIDEFDRKQMYEDSNREWLELHSNDVQRYLDEKVHMPDHERLWAEFLENPFLGKSLIENYSASNDSKVDAVLQEMNKAGRIFLTVGMMGAGKTALNFTIAEMLHNRFGKNVAMIQTDMKLPDWVQQVDNPYELEEGTFVIYDEAAITLAAREFMSKHAKDMTSLMAISRHRNLTFSFITQHTTLQDANVTKLASGFLFKQLTWEEMYGKGKRTDPLMKFVRLMQPSSAEETLFTDGSRWLLFKTGLPSFWSDATSRTYKKISIEEAVTYIRNKLDKGMTEKEIAKQLKVRGIVLPEEDIELAYGRPKTFIADWKKKHGAKA